ncbi:hypothetical protein [Spiroplasma poulsonii]|uniref:hypothetical protein n=1 Tax=Spiroplasma poulsonii TaxID=2138 RepID=UPI0012FFF216|nr:hypothetical protein [Spiroplasma poulsonii]
MRKKYKIRSWVVSFYTLIFLALNCWLEYGMINAIKMILIDIIMVNIEVMALLFY